MKKVISAAFIAAVLLAYGSLSAALVGGGTEVNPYRIGSLEDFDEFADTANAGIYWASNVYTRLECNIDLTGRTYTSAVIAPGTTYPGTVYRGTFNGAGHTIENLTINAPDVPAGVYQYVGLFGYVVGGVITDLGIGSGSIMAGNNSHHQDVGSLCGNTSSATIIRCYSRASVTVGNNTESRWQHAGGLVGTFGGTVTDSYATGNVTGGNAAYWQRMGGFCGQNGGLILRCYSTGLVQHSGGSTSWVKGFCGTAFDNGFILLSYWDVNASGIGTSGDSNYDAIGKATAQMQQDATFVGWNNGAWTIDEGHDYPRLAWEGAAGHSITSDFPARTYSGSGLSGDPFVLSSPAHLINFSQRFPDWDKRFVLANDINMMDVSYVPVAYFEGTFDGQGYSILNLEIQSYWDRIGFFRAVKGVVQDLTIKDANIYGGQQYVGALCGYSNGAAFTRCASTGSVSGSGSYFIGGLIGYAANSSVDTCYSECSVSGFMYGGGLIGIASSSYVTNCYARGSVTVGYGYAGGFQGAHFQGSTDYCYSTGLVSASGSTNVGGFIGEIQSGTVANCLWDSTTSGMLTGYNITYGGTAANVYGYDTALMQMQSTYTSNAWDFEGEVANGTEDFWKMPAGDYPILYWQSDSSSTTGSLRLTITPAAASTAQWRRVGTTQWFNSGDTETDIPAGVYEIQFTDVEGYTTPTGFTVTVNAGELTDAAAAYLPDSPIEEWEITIGTGTNAWEYPLYTWWHDARTQAIYLASEIGGPGIINSLALDVTGLPGQTLNAFTIRMKHTNMAGYPATGAVWESDWIVVHQSAQTITQTGWKEFTFSTPFEYNGLDNLLVDISYNNTSYTSTGLCNASQYGAYRSLTFYTDSGYGDPLTWSGSYPSPGLDTKAPNVKLRMSSSSVVAAPVFTPDAGFYPVGQEVVITCGTPGALIRYTIDGSTPTESNGTVIASGDSVMLTESLTLMAKAWKQDMTPSAVKSADYIIGILPLILNPSFEGSFVDSVASNWTSFDGGYYNPATFSEANIGHAGTKSQQLSFSGVDWGQPGPAGIYQVLNTEPGQIYAVSVWFYKEFEHTGMDGGSETYCDLGIDKNGGVLFEQVSNWNGIYLWDSYSWQKAAIYFKADDVATTLFIRFSGYAYSMDQDPEGQPIPASWTMDCLIDDISVVPVEIGSNATVQVIPPATVQADGIAAAQFAITTFDASGNPLQGVSPADIQITCGSPDAELIHPTVVTDWQGRTEARVASIVPGTYTIGVSVFGIPQTGSDSVTFTEFCPGWIKLAKDVPTDLMASGYFGISSAMDGQWAIVGTSGDGAAYVYHFDGQDWSLHSKLTAPNAYEFGRSVALDGEWAIVGTITEYISGIGYTGSAYIFHYDGANWVQHSRLTAADGANYDYFGYSVAISDGWALVGAYRDDDKGTDSGSAYLYRYDGTTWLQNAKLTPSDGSDYDSFGYSVAISGGGAIVGAYSDDDRGDDSGSAYIYRYDGTNWVAGDKLTAADGTSSDRFGYAVSMSGDWTLVGARYDYVSAYASGSAYLYHFDGTHWVEHSKLAPCGYYANFGSSVCIKGEDAIIGAYSDAVGGIWCSGSACVYRYDGTNWLQKTKLSAADAEEYDYFGGAVAIDGQNALVGAYCNDDHGQDSGSAYFFKRIFIPGDISQDDFVNLSDFEEMARWWYAPACGLGNNWCNGADINSSGQVDLDDLENYVDNWMAGDKVADHVFEIGIETVWDYEAPQYADDDAYDFEIDVITDDTVERVEFTTPAGNTFEITDPQLETDGEWQGCYEWCYEIEPDDVQVLSAYGDGLYTVRVYYAGGGSHETTAWFGIPAAGSPIPQPVQEPLITSFDDGDILSSPVTFAWQPCTDPAAQRISVCAENIADGLQFSGWTTAPAAALSSPLQITPGEYVVWLDFEVWHQSTNGDGISIEVGKYSETDYIITVQ